MFSVLIPQAYLAVPIRCFLWLKEFFFFFFSASEVLMCGVVWRNCLLAQKKSGEAGGGIKKKSQAGRQVVFVVEGRLGCWRGR